MVQVGKEQPGSLARVPSDVLISAHPSANLSPDRFVSVVFLWILFVGQMVRLECEPGSIRWCSCSQKKEEWARIRARLHADVNKNSHFKSSLRTHRPFKTLRTAPRLGPNPTSSWIRNRGDTAAQPQVLFLFFCYFNYHFSRIPTKMFLQASVARVSPSNVVVWLYPPQTNMSERWKTTTIMTHFARLLR